MSLAQSLPHSRETLEQMLKILKSYKVALRQIGKRAILLDPKSPPPIRAKIEYASNIDVSVVQSFGVLFLEKMFPEYTGDSPTLEENPSLIGGIRIFVGDDMVDVSYARLQSVF